MCVCACVLACVCMCVGVRALSFVKPTKIPRNIVVLSQSGYMSTMFLGRTYVLFSAKNHIYIMLVYGYV